MVFNIWTFYKIIFDPMMWLWEMLIPKAKSVELDVDKPNIPLNEAGEKIPQLYGTRMQKSCFLAWYGNLRIVPFYSEVSKK